jgi:uncharacterized protein DUF1592/uncharacterized protein DUF1595/uncharacterized protein DUF1588/uncharacterized protein DUF1585
MDHGYSSSKWRTVSPAYQLHRWAALGLAAVASVGCGATSRNKVDDNNNANVVGGTGGTSPGEGENQNAGSDASPDGGSGDQPRINLEGDPKYFRFVRLTNSQWAKSVQEVLKLAQPSGLEAGLTAPVSGITDFSNNELLLDVDGHNWSEFQAAAEALAEQVTASDDALAAVYPGADATGFIQTVGRRAFRRPLTALEVDEYTELFNQGKTLSGSKSEFAKGAAMVIRALLQAPNFLYRTELGPRGEALDGYEAAAKLSLWLLGTTPSDELLDTAETLTSAHALVDEATSMMAKADARAVMRQFHGEWLRLNQFMDLSKVGVPTYDPALNVEYQEASYLFFDNIFSQGLGVREILTSSRGFTGPGMAELYGLPSKGNGFVEQELGASRAGYFSQLPYLTLNANNSQPNSIHRGLTLALDVLCSVLGPAAKSLPTLAEHHDGQTNRQYIDSLTAACGSSCHNEIMNPLGYAFEHFDGMGQFRETEPGGLPVDSSGSFTFTDGKVDFADNVELMTAMASSEQTHLCYAKKLASFALQRDIVAADLPLLTDLARVSDAGSTQQVMVELVKSDAFRTHGGAP